MSKISIELSPVLATGTYKNFENNTILLIINIYDKRYRTIKQINNLIKKIEAEEEKLAQI